MDFSRYNLPAQSIALPLNEALAVHPAVVITAPPGAGKSTLLPLTMLDAVQGKILMLEPRRIAARQIAERMASMMGVSVGQTVGYRIRFDSKVSEGTLTKMLSSDPTLEGRRNLYSSASSA